ncbi:efflux RND transporter periplasmic adaptor subunit [[Limnothrix rosea] IAM M-220]|uniref:efflux RND transporter periplasmic adaptor subunit n=1 Tax=[Limnothrix rosea] IAM M-220 TaxID=454133 RepID=UPI00096119AF|nr:efflux RND transporter periplasmic adaptor subunit [[Limnothrix rosea] IAM M-220]OKH15920.1 hypothetical protein NIES208_12535 [[Limnothrix rosea] IAM M-220]
MGYRVSQWRSPFFWSTAIGVGLVGIVSCGQPPQQQGQAPMGVPVQMESIQEDIIQTTTEYVGVLEADDLVTLKPEVDGVVQSILIQEGDFIEAGTPIVQLKAERDQASLRQAIASVEASRAAKLSAEAELSAIRAEKIEAEADLKLRQQDLVRIKELVDTGALAERELDQSQRDVAVAQARIDTIQQRIAAAAANINQAQATLVQNNNSVAIASEELQDTSIIAPVSGRVGDLSIKQGDYVERAETLGTITQNQSLNLNFFVPIEQAPRLNLNLPVELIDYRTLETVGTGRVSFISPEVDFTSQTILAKASFDNPEGRLFTGQLVKAKVIWRQNIGVSVPVTAISRIGGETFVFVAQSNPEAQDESAPAMVAVQKPVKLGKIEGDRYEVIEGISLGDKVITTGILNLNDGVPITPVDDSDMAS